MEIKRVDILFVQSAKVSNSEAKAFQNKVKVSANSSFNVNIQKEREEIQKELERVFKNLDRYLERINQVLNPLNKELRVEIDQELNIPIFKIINKETNEIIRQIPLEEILKLIKSMERFWESQRIDEEYLKGLLLKAEV
ncbi:MAG: FlaG/YvyC family protein [Thermodesulfobacterium sp.]|uniref:FlaG/YvyC family protein n=1 Tax=Candidatus Thermodesulfobacterium syntrophicum TaxID=3060442 RepID=A0AAE3TFU3_9BACT|nr:FlaG/YvyC family protein [Candidatus Thermodesulfobacterium syntrophicum]